jgi:hypothetical protein
MKEVCNLYKEKRKKETALPSNMMHTNRFREELSLLAISIIYDVKISACIQI